MDRQPRRTDVLWIAAAHCALAGFLYWRGMNFTNPQFDYDWNWFWQGIPVADLTERPWESLWRLHAQPPGYSLWGLAWLKVCGAGNFPQCYQAGYVLLGGWVVYLTGRLAAALGMARKAAAAAAICMAVNPSLLLYEAYPLYEMLVLALAAGAAAALHRCLKSAEDGGRVWLWLASCGLILNMLALTRSLYHWVFLWGALAFAWPAWRRMKMLPRIALLIAAVAPTGIWYAKNKVQYGFFGPSSWFGIGLYKIVSSNFDYFELLELNRQGAIPDYVQQRSPYQHTPREYAGFGFDKTSDFPLLARDNFHNINMVDISRGYAQASANLMRLHPWRYARSVFWSFCNFCAPPSRFEHLDINRTRHLRHWEWMWAKLLHGGIATDQIDVFTRVQLFSLNVIYFPLTLIFGAVRAIHKRKTAPREALLMAFMVYFCAYTASAGSMFESGENLRFRFPTEPFTIAMIVLAAQTARRRFARKRKTQS